MLKTISEDYESGRWEKMLLNIDLILLNDLLSLRFFTAPSSD